MREPFVLRHLDVQLRFGSLPGFGITRPKHHAVAVRVSGCNSLREEIAAFLPIRLRLLCKRIGPTGGGAHSHGHFHKRASVHSGHRSHSSVRAAMSLRFSPAVPCTASRSERSSTTDKVHSQYRMQATLGSITSLSYCARTEGGLHSILRMNFVCRG